MEDGLHLADALDVAALRLVEAMQGDEDEQVDERALAAVSAAASNSLERFWDWREQRRRLGLPPDINDGLSVRDSVESTP